jgi:hypothetical protein
MLYKYMHKHSYVVCVCVCVCVCMCVCMGMHNFMAEPMSTSLSLYIMIKSYPPGLLVGAVLNT